MAIYFIRKDWLLKLSEMCTEVLEVKITTYDKIAQRFFWHNIAAIINEYVKSYEQCQKQSDLKSPKVELKLISSVMKQVGVDICNLPEVDRYCHGIVLIDYFSKWSEVKPPEVKSAPTSTQFLYEVMCWHGCFKIQTHDQGREFVNKVCKQLHELTRVEQRVTSAYHPQANGLVERQNPTKKNPLVKVLEDNPEMSLQTIEGILFALRVSQHSSTKYSPFMLMYNHEPVLPLDMKHNLNKDESKER